ncbi:MAG: hypothetical protein ACI9TK_000625 [Flavobacteriaceae bacterium]|jgi:hypothetical protein|tara:strand:- start:14658 stop:15050 length:393 start_codon:yes stop_codon:yes gene_type:complete
MYLILIQFLLNLCFPLQENWATYFEDEKVKIEYTSSICGNKKSDLSFEFYIIRIINKVDETLVINFHKGVQENENQEYKVAFVLKPNEIRTGSCDYAPVDLKMHKQKNPNKLSKSPEIFSLSNISLVEVY